jgi:pyruvate/2-oxoglutarate dehydrogenase complex dihydrolipoamide acyltransferase (E2) component
VRAISEEDKIPAVAKPDWKGEPVFSADALRMIESRAMDKSLFMGRDFVNARDVEALLQGNGVSVPKKTTRNSQPDTKPAATVAVDTSQFTVEKISSNKKREINYLSEVQSAGLISMINTTVETDGIFARLNSSLKYFKDSLLTIVMYEVGRLLRKYPLLNAYYDNGSIAYYRNINVGFAVDIGKGLKVLQVPNTDQRSVGEIEQTILELSNKYLDDELQVEHLTNISFTVTDLSAEEVSFFFPLVNAKNSAILGISSVDRKLNRCVLTLSFDHRVTEGKSAAQFLHELKDRLESYQSSYNSNSQQNISCFKCGKSLVSDLSDVGFVKCISPQGSEGYICQSCFKGF